jgi:hypothetical protein
MGSLRFGFAAKSDFCMIPIEIIQCKYIRLLRLEVVRFWRAEAWNDTNDDLTAQSERSMPGDVEHVLVIFMLHSSGKCQIESSCLDKQRSTQFQSSSARGSQSFTSLAFMFSRAENIIIRTMRMLAMVELMTY